MGMRDLYDIELSGWSSSDMFSFSLGNRYPPKFSQDVYRVSVTGLASFLAFFVPEVTDEDQEKICKDAEECPCGEVKFSILTGNEDGLFTIDPQTGALSISQGAVPQKNQYEITVKAANQLNSNSINQQGSTAFVIVNFPEFQNQVESHHHIEKRVKIKTLNEFFHQMS